MSRAVLLGCLGDFPQAGEASADWGWRGSVCRADVKSRERRLSPSEPGWRKEKGQLLSIPDALLWSRLSLVTQLRKQKSWGRGTSFLLAPCVRSPGQASRSRHLLIVLRVHASHTQFPESPLCASLRMYAAADQWGHKRIVMGDGQLAIRDPCSFSDSQSRILCPAP